MKIVNTAYFHVILLRMDERDTGTEIKFDFSMPMALERALRQRTKQTRMVIIT